MNTQYSNHSEKSSAKPASKKVRKPLEPRIFISQIKKIQEEINQLRRDYRTANPNDRLFILRKADERNRFLKHLEDAEEFWRKGDVQ